MKAKIVAFGAGLIAAATLGVWAQISGGGVEGGGGQPAGSPFATQYKNGNRFGGTGPGTSGQVLTSNGNALAPTFQSIAGSTVPNTVQGDTLYASTTNVLSALAKNTSATRYLANTGTNNNPAWAQVDLINGVTGDLPFSNLTQGSALSVLGVTGNATADFASIAAGSDGNVLRRSGTALGFGAITLSSSNAVTGTLGVGNGGTNLTSATDDSVMTGNGTTWESKAVPSCSAASSAVTYNTSTNTWGCNTITGGVAQTTGNFTVSWPTACDTTPTQVWNYVLTGSEVSIRMTQNVSCTSDTTSHWVSATGDIPVALRPAAEVTMFGVGLTNNGSTLSHGCVSIDTAGTIIIELQQSGRCANNGWTATGTRQIRATTQEGQNVFTWVLN